MRVLMILPALTEAVSPFFRPIKYSLFPPLGLASLASHFDRETDQIDIIDEHTMPGVTIDEPPDPMPDLVVIQTYITNARRSYVLADHFRRHGCRVALGGLHATSLPHEAMPHADHLFLGPGDATFPLFIAELRAGRARPRYDSRDHPRSLDGLPPVRRDLIDRSRYLVPNSIVVTRGCPHHCAFCYKDAFFAGGRSFYTQRVDDALREIDALPGRHVYFLDDHLLAHERFARELFHGMRGMSRVFQGASTVDAVLRSDLIELAAEAGLRSVFIGFESISEEGIRRSNKRQNIGRDYNEAIRRLDALGIMVNGSFVFGLDGDGPDVFDRTVDWAVRSGITTATFHIATPYPGTRFFSKIESQGRLLHTDWDLYDTRHAVFEHPLLGSETLESGYWRSYRRFYSTVEILRGSMRHCTSLQGLKHAAYAIAWKKLEPMWNALIRTRQLHAARPTLEHWLGIRRKNSTRGASPAPSSRDATRGTVELTTSASCVMPSDTAGSPNP